jgi:Asp-tRNA(Asn)/Glu-tRNA(Gln) amidotransferase A subunit family amidase
MRVIMEASELDAEQRKAEEDKVAAVVSESKQAAEAREAIATEEAIRLAWSNDPETVVQMQAQVAGLPTQDIEEFKEKIAELGMVELKIPSGGDCFYHAVNASLAGTRISSSMTADELRKQIVAEAMRRGEIDQDETEQRLKQGELVTHDEIQTAANTLRCRIVIYHARPAPGEPDKDIVSPEGNRTTLRDIYMVLRRAHYTVLLNAETVSQTDAAAECVRARVDVDGGRHGQESARKHRVPEIGTRMRADQSVATPLV